MVMADKKTECQSVKKTGVVSFALSKKSNISSFLMAKSIPESG